MSGEQPIHVTIGDVGAGSQVAAGHHISQSITTTAPGPVTEAEFAELQGMLDALRAQIVAEAPPQQQAAALERLAELEEETRAEQPDAGTIAYVGRWFARNIPRLAAAVTGLVVHPIVGKLVGAAGDALVAEFRDL